MGFLNLFKDSGYDIDNLFRRLGIQAVRLETAPLTYQEFALPKKSGGERTISVPNDELKKLQRLLLGRLKRLPKGLKRQLGWLKMPLTKLSRQRRPLAGRLRRV